MSVADNPASPTRPPASGLAAAAAILLRGSNHRLQLAGVEVDIARTHAVTSAVIAGFAIGVSLMAGFSITLCIAAMVWESPNRMTILTSLSMVYVALAAAIVACFIARMRAWRPFSETTHQLNQDYQCLRQLLDQAAP